VNAKISIEKGVVDGYPVMVRVEATDHLDVDHRFFLVGLSKEDAIRMRDDLTNLIVGATP